MAEEENKNWWDSIPLPPWARNLIAGLLAGGLTLGGFYSTASHLLAPSMAKELKEHHGFDSIPPNIIPILHHADSTLGRFEYQSWLFRQALDTINYHIAYQAGVNHLLLKSICNGDTTEDGVIIHNDCYGGEWVEQPWRGIPYIYMAIPMSGEYAITKFKWQLNDGEKNLQQVVPYKPEYEN